MSSRLEFSSYPFAGRDEFCLTIGANHAKNILIIPPLFDEMNRVRRMLVDVMRLLDETGIGAVLPDLPGTNESTMPLENANFAMWKEALTACAATHDCHEFIASIRGGCLIDHFSEKTNHWRLSPVKGSNLLRTMMRTRIAGDKEAGIATNMAQLTENAQNGAVELAGNIINSELFSDLQDAVPAQVEQMRLVRLRSDSQDADVKIEGSALWLRAEPDADPILSKAIADDLRSWVQS